MFFLLISIFFIISAFTKEQFDYVLSQTIPISIYIGIISLAFTVIKAIVVSLLAVKGIQNKIFTTFVTSLYTIIMCFIFAISIVCNMHKHLKLASSEVKI